MKKLTVLALFCLCSLPMFAQYYFMPAIASEDVLSASEVFVVTNAGDTLRGRVSGCNIVNGQVNTFTLKKEDKTKIKYAAADVKLLAVKPTVFMKYSGQMSLQNFMKMSKEDLDKIMNREWIYFEQALLPKNTDKYALLQLLNPGFDSKIKVYQDPNAGTTGGITTGGGLQLTGGENNSFLVVVNGGKSEYYRQVNYKKDAINKLYRDCPVFLENYSGEKFKWKDFSEHVLVYDQMCTE